MANCVVVKRDNDWCFLCTIRKKKLVGISYEQKNEEDRPATYFLRICKDCLSKIQKVMDDKSVVPNAIASVEK